MADSTHGPLPVYLSFSTFRSAVQNLRAHGLPTKLDRSAWGSRSGAEQGQIISALKFMGLIDPEGTTQESLRRLTAVPEDSPEEKRLLAELLRSRYQKVFELDLASATPKQLTDVIGDYGVTGATKDRSVRFFVRAAQYCGIPISPRLTARMKSRSAASDTEETTASDNSTPTKPNTRGRRRRKANGIQPQLVSPPSVDTTSSPMKTIQLPKVGGTLSVTGTFNPFNLVGEERALVYQIIDAMTEYEERSSISSAP